MSLFDTLYEAVGKTLIFALQREEGVRNKPNLCDAIYRCPLSEDFLNLGLVQNFRAGMFSCCLRSNLNFYLEKQQQD